MLLNTTMAQSSFILHQLQANSDQLTDTQDALNQSLAASRSPANLASRAAGMGLVPASSSAFLRLSDGKVIGVAKPASPGPAFTVVRNVAPAPVAAGAKPTKAGASSVATRTKPAKAASSTAATSAKPAKLAKPAKPVKPAKPAKR